MKENEVVTHDPHCLRTELSWNLQVGVPASNLRPPRHLRGQGRREELAALAEGTDSILGALGPKCAGPHGHLKQVSST